MSRPAPSGATPDRVTTSRAVRAGFLVVLTGLLLLRLPDTLEVVRRAMPAGVAADVGDDRLLDLAVHVGALLGLALTVVSALVFLVVAGLLERHLPPSVAGRGRLRTGAPTATVVACYLVSQARGLLSPPTASLQAGLVPVALAVLTGLVVGLGFAWRGRSGATRRGVLAGLLATTGLALATSVTTLSA